MAGQCGLGPPLHGSPPTSHLLGTGNEPASHAPYCTCLPTHPPSLCAQGELMMVAVQLMLGGSLRGALLDPERQQQLRWEAR